MDCRTARHLLDCLNDGSSDAMIGLEDDRGPVSRQDLLDHLDSCIDCQHVVEERQFFDRRMYSALMSSPVPSELENRLLSLVETTLAPMPVPAKHPSVPQRLVRSWKSWTALASMLLLAVTLWMVRPQTEEQLNFGGAGQLLSDHFLKANSPWQDLDEFDGSFDLGSYRSDLGELKLSPARGIDLGGGRGQDAAVFQFGLKNWGGIITVLPSQHYTGLPDGSTPSVQAGRSVLQWRSSDGKLTYICFVHKGSAAALAQELFGLLI